MLTGPGALAQACGLRRNLHLAQKFLRVGCRRRATQRGGGTRRTPVARCGRLRDRRRLRVVVLRAGVLQRRRLCHRNASRRCAHERVCACAGAGGARRCRERKRGRQRQCGTAQRRHGHRQPPQQPAACASNTLLPARGVQSSITISAGPASVALDASRTGIGRSMHQRRRGHVERLGLQLDFRLLINAKLAGPAPVAHAPLKMVRDRGGIEAPLVMFRAVFRAKRVLDAAVANGKMR